MCYNKDVETQDGCLHKCVLKNFNNSRKGSSVLEMVLFLYLSLRYSTSDIMPTTVPIMVQRPINDEKVTCFSSLKRIFRKGDTHIPPLSSLLTKWYVQRRQPSFLTIKPSNSEICVWRWVSTTLLYIILLFLSTKKS